MPGTTLSPLVGTEADAARRLAGARERTLALVAPLERHDLERVHSKLMSPLVWDLGHIAAYEDLWLVHRHGGRPLLRPDLMEVYDAFETPRAARGDLPYLRHHESLDYLEEVRARTLHVLAERGLGDGLLHELVLRHEHQHNETMLQTLQLARLGHYRPERRPPPASGAAGGPGWVHVPAGRCTVGAPAGGFAFDNERGRHTVDLPPFRMGRTPVTNASFLSFTEGGGYRRREWWSREGWSWKEEYDIARPAGWDGHGREWRMGSWEPLHPERPVVHVSWFEADAFARAHGARLPTESEWEKAATWDQQADLARAYPWGAEPPTAERANLGQLAFGTDPVGTRPAGESPSGCRAMLGDVWEWTASHFTPYPGFVARPYREYSEVFFGSGYRVLRGGSWATSERVATPTFRNWDLPARRQIFAGFRLARDDS